MIGSVIGLIAVGKTGFIERLKNLEEFSEKDIIIFCEPSPDNNLLKKYYDKKNDKKYMEKISYEIQIDMCQKRFKQYKKAIELKNEGKIVILDQSILSDSIYGKANKENMNKVDYEKYLQYNKECIEQCSDDLPSKILYLRCSPTISKRRIEKRAVEDVSRQSELTIDLQYLKKLHQGYETWAEYNQTKNIVKEIIIEDWNEFPSTEYFLKLCKKFITY